MCDMNPKCSNYLVLKNPQASGFPSVCLYDNTLSVLTHNTDWDTFTTSETPVEKDA
tara:strand:+ start:234 stop:401 length:168 start_codon:yes stop_codon:yes gene_type:complete